VVLVRCGWMPLLREAADLAYDLQVRLFTARVAVQLCTCPPRDAEMSDIPR